jgi:GTP-binding protein EngB required for normal cell division
MKYFKKGKSIKNFQSILVSLVWLLCTVIASGCKRSDPEPNFQLENIEITNNFDKSENYRDIEIKNNPCNTIVVFLGNPGVGKSALGNSIFQKNIFKSGISFVGLTQVTQEYTIGDIKYTDTPGLDDLINKEKAAQEIEKALKGNNNYKVIFVATLEGGRIRASDFATINAVCEAIHEADFEYGIIFNKMNKDVLNYTNQNREGFNNILALLPKPPKPESVLFIEEDRDMLDESDIYFPKESANYTKLSEYINKLKPIKINRNNVGKININNYQEQVVALEAELARIKREQAKKIEEMEKKHREEISSIKIATEKQINSIRNIYDGALEEIKKNVEVSSAEREMRERVNSLKSAFKDAFDVLIASMEQDPTLNKEKFEENRKKIEEARLELDNDIKNIQKTTADKFKELIGSGDLSSQLPLHRRQL